MPPRRRTFYLADATVLANPKVRGLSRSNPDEWLAAWGAFHILIGVATINGSPRLSSRDLADVLGPEHVHLAELLRRVGLLTRSGIDPDTFAEWCPKPRPHYPSDDTRGDRRNSAENRPTTPESDTIPPESPTSSTSSSSRAASSPPSRGVGHSAGRRNGLKALNGDDAIKALDAEYARGELTSAQYRERRAEIEAA